MTLHASSTATVPDYVIAQINSLGGPPLPMRQSGTALRVIMENTDAANVSLSGWKVALAIASRR